jgi:hypothetical protein
VPRIAVSSISIATAGYGTTRHINSTFASSHPNRLRRRLLHNKSELAPQRIQPLSTTLSLSLGELRGLRIEQHSTPLTIQLRANRRPTRQCSPCFQPACVRPSNTSSALIHAPNPLSATPGPGEGPLWLIGTSTAAKLVRRDDYTDDRCSRRVNRAAMIRHSGRRGLYCQGRRCGHQSNLLSCNPILVPTTFRKPIKAVSAPVTTGNGSYAHSRRG